MWWSLNSVSSPGSGFVQAKAKFGQFVASLARSRTRFVKDRARSLTIERWLYHLLPQPKQILSPRIGIGLREPKPTIDFCRILINIIGGNSIFHCPDYIWNNSREDIKTKQLRSKDYKTIVLEVQFWQKMYLPCFDVNKIEPLKVIKVCLSKIL